MTFCLSEQTERILWWTRSLFSYLFILVIFFATFYVNHEGNPIDRGTPLDISQN